MYILAKPMAKKIIQTFNVLLVNAILIFAIMFGVEVYWRYFKADGVIQGVQTTYKPQFFYLDDEFGFYTKPSQRYLAIRESSIGKTENYFDIDQFSRRRVDLKTGKVLKKHLILGGCSFVFGEGLDQNETLPQMISDMRHEYAVYNYGFPGWGTQQIYQLTKNYRLKNEIEFPTGKMVYMSYFGKTGHLRRLEGSLRVHWSEELPKYVLKDSGEIERNGTLHGDIAPLRNVFGFLMHSAFFSYYYFDIPLNPSNEVKELYIEMVKRMKEKYLAMFPGSEFFVAIHPFSHPEISSNMVSLLIKSKINVLDYSSKVNFYAVDWWKRKGIPGDGHPNEKLNLELAESLYTDLKLAGD